MTVSMVILMRFIVAWNLLFDSLWDDFGDRFKSILGRLKSFKELVDKEVPVSEIQE